MATTLFAANDASTLIGSNAAGSAVGGGFYDFRSFGTFGYPAFFVAAGSNSIRLLQPTCGPHAPCVSVSPARGQQCPFGGCEITANGSIFLDDQLITPDGTIQVINLDVTAQSPTINNSNQILYLDGNHVQIYQIGTGAVTTIPAIPGSSCIALSPLSFNDAGQVLGVTDSCTKSTDYTYFVYDPKSGTKELIAELPSGSASVTPVGINNNGQILVGLTLPSGIIHWGTLNPITAQTHSNTRLRRN